MTDVRSCLVATEVACALAAGVRSARSCAVGKEIPPPCLREICNSKAANSVDRQKTEL